jgi:hypothetical protein
MKYFKLSLFIYAFVLFSISCNQDSANDNVNVNPIANSTAKDLSEVESFVGRGPGEETFKTSCLTCHSLRYIQMQPNFPRKTWEKIVDKMIKSFGAPISDSSAKVIVNYLASAKGK